MVVSEGLNSVESSERVVHLFNDWSVSEGLNSVESDASVFIASNSDMFQKD